MTPAADPRMLRVLTLDQLSDYHRVLYDQLGGLVGTQMNALNAQWSTGDKLCHQN